MSGDKLKTLINGTLFGIGIGVGLTIVRAARIVLGVPFIMDTKEGVRMALLQNNPKEVKKLMQNPTDEMLGNVVTV